MNKDLIDILILYTTKSHKEVVSSLLEKSKDNLIAIFNDLLTTYINDKNSSTLREFITVKLAGYEHSSGKIGYNGYKHSSDINGKSLQCEAKPKNFDTEEYLKYKNKERKTSPSKLNGGGNFTDYTIARFEKDKRENLNMLVSGFVDGRLIYIIEFPFNSNEFTENLNIQLKKHFKNGDEVTKYLRGARFNYQNFINIKNLKIVYLLAKKELENYKEYIIKDFYLWMSTKIK